MSPQAGPGKSGQGKLTGAKNRVPGQLSQEIIGHEEIMSFLRKAVATERVNHAYLFQGPLGVGKSTVARAFARALLCSRPQEGEACGVCRACLLARQGNHPDLLTLQPSPTTIKIDQVRALQDRIALSSYQGFRQVCLIERAETMTSEAANCFLKVLEEPPAGVVFLLLSAQPYALLPTVVSRCQQVTFRYLPPVKVEEGLVRLAGKSREDAALTAALAGGSLGRAMELAAKGNLAGQRKEVFTMAAALGKTTPGEACRLARTFAGDRDSLLVFFETLLLWYRDLLIWLVTGDESLVINRDLLSLVEQEAKNYSVLTITDIIYMVNQAKNKLRANANPGLTAEVLFLYLGGGGESCPTALSASGLKK